MNCIQDDQSTDAEALSPDEAYSFLSTIQTLPSADYRRSRDDSFTSRHKNDYAYNARDDAPSITSAASDEDIPFNICQGAWGDDDTAVENHCACDIQVEDAHSLMHMNSFQSERGSSIQGELEESGSISEAPLMDGVNLHSRVSSCVSGCSVVTEVRDEFERGRDECSPTRGGFRAVEGMDLVSSECVKQNVSDAPATVKRGRGRGMRRKFSKLSPLGKQKKNHVTKETVVKADETPDVVPAKEPATSTLNLADKKSDEVIVSSSSICTASETVSTSNTAPISNRSGALKNMSPSKFLRSLKSKRATVAAAASNESKHRVNFSDDDPSEEVECHSVGASSLKVVANASAEEELEPVHLLSLTPEDTPMKYDEICYGPTSPSVLATPAPLVPIQYSQLENSIVKSNTEMKQEVEGKVPSLSPIASKSYIKRAVTNDSVELDATGSITMTPDSMDYLNRSNETEVHLSEISRALFSDDNDTMANVEDIRFDGLGDDDAFECMLQNDEVGVFDITVEGMKMEKQLEEMCEEMAETHVRELNVLSSRDDHEVDEAVKNETQQIINAPSQVSAEKSKAKPVSFGDLFQMDMSGFGDLFGCNGSSSNVKSTVAEVQCADCDTTEQLSTECDEKSATVKIEKQHSCEVGDESFDVASLGIGNDTIDQNGNKIEPPFKQGWIKSMRSRTGSSLSLRKQSFGFVRDGRRHSQEVKLEMVDEDIEATI
jgi:hypothetical protein